MPSCAQLTSDSSPERVNGMTQQGESRSSGSPVTKHEPGTGRSSLRERRSSGLGGGQEGGTGARAKPVHGAVLCRPHLINLVRLCLSTGPAAASVSKFPQTSAHLRLLTSHYCSRSRKPTWRPGFPRKQRQGVLSRMRARDTLDGDPGIGPTPARPPRRVSALLSSMRAICLAGWRYKG